MAGIVRRLVGSERGVAVVLPIRGELPLLTDALACLQNQARKPNEIIVVDDSPSPVLGETQGITILHSGGAGPYAARNVGWRASDANLVLFLDVRSRPHPDWVLRTVERFADPAVAIVGSEVSVRGGSSLAEQAAQRHQFFELRKYVAEGFFRPYFPTCNLAIRREDLAAVNGFTETRSGADADLCWRVLERPGRRLEAIPEVLMDWVPRVRMRDYLEQSYRYGRSNYGLRRAWRVEGAPQLAPVSRRLLARRLLRLTVRTVPLITPSRRGALTIQVREWARLASQIGYRVAADEEKRGEP